MKTKEFNIYKYNEIEDEKQRGKILEKYRDILIDDNFAFLEDDLKEILKEDYNINNAKVYYNFGYSQGNGLRFECDDLLASDYLKKVVKAALTKNEKAQMTNILKKYYLTFKSIHGGHHLYNYATKYDIDYDFSGDNMTEKQEKLINKIVDILTDEYLNICKRLELIGYGCYDVDNGQVMDYFDENDINFININGKYMEV